MLRLSFSKKRKLISTTISNGEQVYFHKIDNPMNFRFPPLDKGSMRIFDPGEDTYSLYVDHKKWPGTDTDVSLIYFSFSAFLKPPSAGICPANGIHISGGDGLYKLPL